MRVRQADPACRRCCILKGARLGKVCALVTDGRFSGGSSGVAVGHISPEAAAGGVIGLVEDGDLIVIDVQERALRLMVDDDVLAERRAKMDASERPWQPVDRQRPVASRFARTPGWPPLPPPAQSATCTADLLIARPSGHVPGGLRSHRCALIAHHPPSARCAC